MTSKITKTILILLLIFSSYPLLAQGDNLRHGVETIVIDAGHGGKDPGTHGEFSNEKTVVLGISLKLADYIKKKYPYMNVILTRKEDVFLTLSERAEIANENDADLFICIHANAAGSEAAHGTETFVLRLGRAESQLEVAKRENSTLLLEVNGREKYENFNSTPDAIIARRLLLNVNLQKSINIASKIQSQFESIGRHNRGVKQAGFWVLHKTTVPGILIETGFLTNDKEEKFLNSEEGQIKIANSIFRAFQAYVAEVNGVEALIEDAEGFEESLQNVQANKNPEENQVYFRVQIATTEEKVDVDDSRFKNLQVSRYQQNGLYKYAVGLFKNDFTSANEYKKEMRNLGFKGAFVVGFLNGERIPIANAIKLATEKN